MRSSVLVTENVFEGAFGAIDAAGLGQPNRLASNKRLRLQRRERLIYRFGICRVGVGGSMGASVGVAGGGSVGGTLCVGGAAEVAVGNTAPVGGGLTTGTV